jgi:hypothetical protein
MGTPISQRPPTKPRYSPSRSQSRAVFWPAPARVKVSSLAVRSLDDFLAQTSKAEQIAAFRAEHGVTSNDQLLEVILRFAPMAK